ncbi:granule-bound starch synthase 1, chloroplastic/amyloplastic [Physcomitrium patens]|uniref:Starch synthase, chloroplastic/amyloplastic n=1 Tax=Physcomitrium patens TaxID=3218 RepID=A0A2K1J1T7_PHYPA|nr:granule-bound starch synthase 1, chloroplastic/amyloplastic-like [Physcomitrium patens]PNR35490.1 hypothetical protein PHYPA_023390 [Physcomitrium patens]|eukprot:XP_024402880.1 granule-bound starch synthase 1, chloroplastic/amyloplastic-like [Physcomitrella patens]
MAMAMAPTHLCATKGALGITQPSSSKDAPKCGEMMNGMVSFQGLRTTALTHRVEQMSAMSLVGKVKARSVVSHRRPAAGARCSTTNGSGGRNHSGMSIIFVAAEVAPWSKTGGLGDVLGGLPPALAARGHRVMTVSPRYDQYKDAWDTSTPTEITIGDRTEMVNFFHTHKRGVDRIFVDHPLYLSKVWGKTGSKIYGPRSGEDYDDNQFRFMLLAKAAIEAAKVLSLDSNEYFNGPYGENVVFVANDWHTALLPCYLKSEYKPAGQFENAKVAFCVHNIAYQGRFAFADFDKLGLPDKFRSSFDFIDGYEKPVKGRKINWMKAGFLESDLNMTVSPNYASELSSGVDKGVELDTIVRMEGIIGICNGMDVQEWDPSADKYLDTPYDISTVFDAKPELKAALQAEVGLPVRPDVPLFGFIGRLEEQKGSDILAEAVKDFLMDDVQLIVLGTGKKHLEKQLEELDSLFPDKAIGVVKFNTPLAHMITAGADFLLVPSRFEPCGLIQLHAMRYGTVPVVASTGGLVDTVEEGVTGFQCGKAFNVDCEVVDPADAELLSATVKRAVKIYGTAQYKKMIRNCMSQDLSWKDPARKWEDSLLGLQVEGSGPGQEGEEIAPKAKANVATP